MSKFETLATVALEEGLRETGKMLSVRAHPRGEHHSKRVYARKIGLAYWPALIGELSCDPKAFLAFEKFQASQKVVPWGARRSVKELMDWKEKCGGAPHEELGKHRGGWDSCGHWGASPDFVSKAWFAAGCRENGKLFVQFSSGVVAKKGDSITFFKNFLRGGNWLAKNYFGGRSNGDRQYGWAIIDRYSSWSRKALAALGRLSPEARHWAVRGVSGTHQKPVRVRDMNWQAVSHMEDLRWNSSTEALHERQAAVPRKMAFTIAGLPHDSTGNNPGFVVNDNSDGVAVVLAEKPIISVAGCAVFVGETVVITTEKPKRMYLVRKGNRSYHFGWKEVSSPREALREALGAWRRQDEATKTAAEKFVHLFRDDVTILVTRNDSYRAGNCELGTEAWIDSTGVGHNRWCVPASALLARAGEGRVANVLAVANRAAGVYLATVANQVATASWDY